MAYERLGTVTTQQNRSSELKPAAGQDANLEWTPARPGVCPGGASSPPGRRELGNEKIIGIADTVLLDNRSPLANDLRRPCYKGITTAQTHLLAVTLLGGLVQRDG